VIQSSLLVVLLAAAARDRGLGDLAVRVLAWCANDLSPHEFRALKAEGLAVMFGRRRQTIGQALHALVMHGYLLEGPRCGSIRTYRLLIDSLQREATDPRSTLLLPRAAEQMRAIPPKDAPLGSPAHIVA